jgi:hypothetical protein
MTDLEMLSAEAAPRSSATCARLQGRVASLAGIVGYSVLWFFVAVTLATPLLLVGIWITGAHASHAAASVVISIWIGGFLLSWVPFGLWMARRRARARALIRDGLLVDAVVEQGRPSPNAAPRPTSASIRFSSSDGHEHRALFALNALGASPGPAQRALFSPTAEHCLVLSPAGKAIPATVVRDIAIERGEGRTIVTLRRGRTEKIVTGVLVVMLIEMIYFAIVLTWLQRPAELHCNRTSDACTVSGSDIFFERWSGTFPASQMSRSIVRKKSNGDIVWELRMTDGSSRSLGGVAGSKRQREEYQRNSDALGAFIADHEQEHFEARFSGMTSDPLLVWGLIFLALGYPLARLIHGWRTTLVFDGTVGDLTIMRSPALLAPAQRTLKLASVARAVAVRTVVWFGLAAVPMRVLRLVGADGTILFRRRLTIDADLAPELSAIEEALGRR